MNIFNSANILIPKNIDLSKWSVVACDQHTSNPKYWEDVKTIIGNTNSSYNIIVPEVYLNLNKQELIANANLNMNNFLKEQIFEEYNNSVIYVERTLSNDKIRQGVIGKIDLEHYSEKITDNTLIKPSEEIVQERIPTRIEIRENAVLDMPHIILFCANSKKDIIEPLSQEICKCDKLYDFDLMLNGGNIKGYRLDDDLAESVIIKINNNLKEFGLIVADGNHSLVAAKRVYEQYKKTHKDYLESPLRFALVEVVNLYNDAVEIEPIYRVVKNINCKKLLDSFSEKFSPDLKNNAKEIEVISKNFKKKFYFDSSKTDLEIKEIQEFLDEYLKTNEGEIDYIHELNKLEELSNCENAVGFKFGTINKDMIVEYTKNKVFPRKTFSIGSSLDKRYYLECRKLV